MHPGALGEGAQGLDHALVPFEARRLLSIRVFKGEVAERPAPVEHDALTARPVLLHCEEHELDAVLTGEDLLVARGEGQPCHSPAALHGDVQVRLETGRVKEGGAGEGEAL